jgi:hypothetical protein
MIKYFHELRHEEFQWLCKEGNTWEEVAMDFPGPPWCVDQACVVDPLGCWSLISFENGHSAITGPNTCSGCSWKNSNWEPDDQTTT